MADREDDLRLFIQQQMARSDRVLRENSRVIAENSRVITEVIAEIREWRAERRAQLADEHDERRAVIAALMQLIDRIDRLGPGNATA